MKALLKLLYVTSPLLRLGTSLEFSNLLLERMSPTDLSVLRHLAALRCCGHLRPEIVPGVDILLRWNPHPPPKLVEGGLARGASRSVFDLSRVSSNRDSAIPADEGAIGHTSVAAV